MNGMLKCAMAGMICLLASCGGEKKNSVDDLSWMLGSWQGVTAEGQRFSEQWEKDATGAMVGKGCGLGPDGDTLFKEVLKVETIEGTPYYIATIPSNPGPVHFKLVSLEGNSAHFENKAHDFPQQINYTLEKQNVIHVELFGTIDGKKAKQELVFEKIN